MGQQVVRSARRDSVGTIASQPRLIGGRLFYVVSFGSMRESLAESELELAESPDDLDSLLRRNQWGQKQTLSRIVTFTKLREPLRDVLYSFRATRTIFEPFQFKPLIKFLESPNQRLLIADEVGLGKTIEAGYILRELRARSPRAFRRVMIVAPAALRLKWQEELHRRFDERFDILDVAGVRRLLEVAQHDGSSMEFKVICSMQSLRGRRSGDGTPDGRQEADWESSKHRQPSLLDELEAGLPPLDLVIVDEAHHLRNPSSLVHRLGDVLSDKADAMLFLTATPIHIGSENLFHLLRLLDAREFDSLPMFNQRVAANEFIIDAERRLRSQHPADFDGCRAALEQLRGMTGEQGFVSEVLYNEIHDKLDRYDASRRDQVVQIQHDLIQLNVLAHVLTRTRKREVQEHRPTRTAQVVRPEWSEAEAGLYGAVTEFCRRVYCSHTGEMAAQFAVLNLQQQMASSIPAMLERYGRDAIGGDEFGVQADLGEEQAADYSVLRDPAFRALLREHGDAADRDTKFEALRTTLDDLERVQAGRKVVLFSFFKHTLKYLERRLNEAGVTTVLISGDVPSMPTQPHRDERGKRIRRFHQDPSVRVLLSSEVGSEGIDFHTASHIIVNYDLPWNPMRVEQRIGRLDRFGQESDRIIIVNFSIPGTIENEILTRLYNRIRVFEETIGDLEPIIGDEIRGLTDDLMRSDLTPEELESLLEDRARALERRRQDERLLEESSSKIVGSDEYFMDRIRAVDANRQFLTRVEMEMFVSEFLEQIGSKWKPAGEPGIFQMTWTRDIDTIVRGYLRRAELASAGFLDTAFGDALLVTCDSDLGYRRGDVELLTEHHPVVRAIAHYYEQRPQSLHPVGRVLVSESECASNDYFYALYLLNQRGGLREAKYLEAVFVGADGSVLDADDSRTLLYEMMTRGETLEPPPILEPEQVDCLQEAADEELVRRRDERLAELDRSNVVYIDTRLVSLRATHRAKRAKLEERLESGRAKGAQERYLRMIEGSLRNLDADHNAKLSEIEAGRRASIGFHCFAAGVVRVA